MGLPPEYHEDGPPEYPTPPDEWNRFAPVVEPVRTKSRLRKVLLLLVAGLPLLGFFSPLKAVLPAAEPEEPVETYLVQAWHEPPSGARVTLTVDGSDQTADGVTGVNVPEGAVVRVHYDVSMWSYTEDDVSLGGTMLEGALYETDEPLAFRVGQGGGVIHFYLNFPSDVSEPSAPDATPEPTGSPAPTPEPTPDPSPDVTVVYYNTSSVFHGHIDLNMPERISAVHVQLWDEFTQTAALEYDFTEEDLALGYYEFSGFDLSEFYWEHREEFDAADTFPNPYLEATITYTGDDGSEQTLTRSARAQGEDWVALSYDEPDLDWSWLGGDVYPDCFVARVYPTMQDTIYITMDPDEELQNGNVFLSITVDGQTLVTDDAYLVKYEDEYTVEGETYVDIMFVYVIPRPKDFPEHGTAHFTITQKLIHYDLIVTRERDYEY